MCLNEFVFCSSLLLLHIFETIIQRGEAFYLFSPQADFGIPYQSSPDILGLRLGTPGLRFPTHSRVKNVEVS